jgi:predicted Zn-dependent peptidase
MIRILSRKLSFAILIVILVLTAARATAPAPETAKSMTLDNGLKVFLLEKRNYPLVSAVAAVNVGAKDETAETNGLTHVLEHYILFRGTELRSGSQVSREVREHGAYFNAHTSEDLSLFEISVPAAWGEFAINNEKEIIFNLKITQAELDEEKEVILEEISQLEDDPARYATSLAYQNLFKGQAYGNPVHGQKDVIKALTAERLQEFYRRFFVPANCSLAVVGDLGLKEMEEMVKRIFGGIKGEPFEKPKFEMTKPPAKGVDIEVEMDVQKAYLLIAVPGPDYNHPDQYALEVLTEIIGRGVNPMLYSALMGRKRLAETLFMSYQAYKYGGAVLTYLTLDPKDLNSAKREALSFLRQSREQNFARDDYFGDQQSRAFDYLAGAKNQIRYNAFLTEEKGLSLAASLASFLLLSDGGEGRAYLENIEKVKSGDLRKAAGKYFGRSEYVIISVIPKKNG